MERMINLVLVLLTARLSLCANNPIRLHSSCLNRREPGIDSQNLSRVHTQESLEEIIRDKQPKASGAFGKVYIHSFGGKELAIKVSNISDNNINEINLLWKFQHYKVFPTIFACEISNSKLFSIQELLYEDLIKQDSKRIIREKNFYQHLDWYSDLFFALEKLHEKNIIHRDVKPENIMFVDRDGENIKLIDLGVSSQDSDKINGGTPLYMPSWLFKLKKEKFNKKGDDIYSSALTILEIELGSGIFTEPFSICLKDNRQSNCQSLLIIGIENRRIQKDWSIKNICGNVIAREFLDILKKIVEFPERISNTANELSNQMTGFKSKCREYINEENLKGHAAKINIDDFESKIKRSSKEYKMSEDEIKEIEAISEIISEELRNKRQNMQRVTQLSTNKIEKNYVLVQTEDLFQYQNQIAAGVEGGDKNSPRSTNAKSIYKSKKIIIDDKKIDKSKELGISKIGSNLNSNKSAQLDDRSTKEDHKISPAGISGLDPLVIDLKSQYNYAKLNLQRQSEEGISNKSKLDLANPQQTGPTRKTFNFSEDGGDNSSNSKALYVAYNKNEVAHKPAHNKIHINNDDSVRKSDSKASPGEAAPPQVVDPQDLNLREIPKNENGNYNLEKFARVIFKNGKAYAVNNESLKAGKEYQQVSDPMSAAPSIFKQPPINNQVSKPLWQRVNSDKSERTTQPNDFSFNQKLQEVI